MRTEEELAWRWRTRRVWIVMAALFTILPCVSFASSGLAYWVGGPHTWGGRIAVWSGAAFFWVLYIIQPTRRNVALAVAIAVSLAETALILNRLGVIQDQASRASNLEIIGIGLGAALFWFWYVRSANRRPRLMSR